MPSPPRLHRVAIVVLTIGVVSALGSGLAGIVLARIYRPGSPAEFAGVNADWSGSDSWSNWHLLFSVIFLAATIGTLAVLALSVGRGQIVEGARLVVCPGIAVLAAVVTLVTTGAVEWDQLAMRTVTTGSNIRGYWYAAFNDDVQFILVGNTEMSQGEYVPMLVAHLGAPIVGIGVLLIAAVALVRSS